MMFYITLVATIVLVVCAGLTIERRHQLRTRRREHELVRKGRREAIAWVALVPGDDK